MILFDKICSTDIEHCVVAQSSYYNINVLSIDNKGVREQFSYFFFYKTHANFQKVVL